MQRKSPKQAQEFTSEQLAVYSKLHAQHKMLHREMTKLKCINLITRFSDDFDLKVNTIHNFFKTKNKLEHVHVQLSELDAEMPVLKAKHEHMLKHVEDRHTKYLAIQSLFAKAKDNENARTTSRVKHALQMHTTVSADDMAASSFAKRVNNKR